MDSPKSKWTFNVWGGVLVSLSFVDLFIKPIFSCSIQPQGYLIFFCTIRIVIDIQAIKLWLGVKIDSFSSIMVDLYGSPWLRIECLCMVIFSPSGISTKMGIHIISCSYLNLVIYCLHCIYRYVFLFVD